MIWSFTKSSYESSISPWVRRWIGGTIFDRLIMITVPGVVWATFWFWVAVATRSFSAFVFFFFIFGLMPWYFWIVDMLLDHVRTRSDLDGFTLSEDVILATRCEYLGGHPELPHGRFAYLLLEGTRDDPNLTLGFPTSDGKVGDYFSMPLLDLAAASSQKIDSVSLAGDLASSFTSEMSANIKEGAGRFLKPERLSLVVDYEGPGASRYKVELTNFFRGNEEVRNWQNYLICSKAEAVAGVKPHQPWKSLKVLPAPPAPALLQEGSIDASGNGSQRPARRSAFARR